MISYHLQEGSGRHMTYADFFDPPDGDQPKKKKLKVNTTREPSSDSDGYVAHRFPLSRSHLSAKFCLIFFL